MNNLLVQIGIQIVSFLIMGFILFEFLHIHHNRVSLLAGLKDPNVQNKIRSGKMFAYLYVSTVVVLAIILIVLPLVFI